jgi:predicted HTH transcriptional regulator
LYRKDYQTGEEGSGNIDPAFFSPYPKNPVIAKFFKEIGRADELGSGIRNTLTSANSMAKLQLHPTIR